MTQQNDVCCIHDMTRKKAKFNTKRVLFIFPFSSMLSLLFIDSLLALWAITSCRGDTKRASMVSGVSWRYGKSYNNFLLIFW